MKSIHSVGVKLTFNPDHGWLATVQFSTWEGGSADRIDGSIGTHYFNRDLAAAVDCALTAAKAIGVVFHEGNPDLEPSVYVEGDGEDPAVPLPPNWRQLVSEQCIRLGWKDVHHDEPSVTHRAPAQVQ